MAGRRALTRIEERKLLAVVRRLPAPHRALITIQWMTGFRISECLSLRVGQILRGGELVDKIGIAPRNLKGKRGQTRYVPVLPELARALKSHLAWLRMRFDLIADMPLFISRQAGPGGSMRALSADAALRISHRAFACAGIANDGRLGCHVWRKTWAGHVLKASGQSVAVLQKALAHRSLESTQRYIDIGAAEVESAMRGCDFTRRPRRMTMLDSTTKVVAFPRRPSDKDDPQLHLCLPNSLGSDSAPDDRLDRLDVG